MQESGPEAASPEGRDKDRTIRESGLHYLTGEAMELQEFEEAMAYFWEHRDAIVARYEGNYVAILNGEIVDHDEKRVQLAERVYKRFGYRPMYMPYVSTEKQAPRRMGSPRRLSLIS